MHLFAYMDSSNALSLGLVIALLALLALELINSQRVGRLASSAFDYANAKAEKEADHIVTEAREKARALLERAEAESIRLAAERAKEDEAAEHAHDEALKKIHTDFEAFITRMTDETQTVAREARTALGTELAQLGETARGSLASATGEAKKQFTEGIAKALAGALAEARDAAKHYEQARRESVDTHILALVSETTKIALDRSLPEEAHAALVKRALEEAKSAHIF